MKSHSLKIFNFEKKNSSNFKFLNFFISLFVHINDKKKFWSSKKFYSINRENEKDYFLNPFFYKDRKHGLSAFMRIKNDEDWIYMAIMSVIDYVDEIVIVLQNCTDNTEKIIKEINSPKIKIHYFPFESFPSGINENRLKNNSIHNRAYYYNYALSLTKFSYVWKWDGDHAAFEDRVAEIRKLIDSNLYEIIHYKGYDIYGLELKNLCIEPYCANEPSIFKVNKKTFYFEGKLYEEFSYPLSVNFKKLRIYNYPKPLFIHFKYAKGIEYVGKGWPENWRNIESFANLVKSKSKGEIYSDKYPKIVLSHYFKQKI